MSAWIALITVLTVLLMAGTGAFVGVARGKYQVKAPATSGHPMFERAYRVQMNTIEQVLLFLPALWLAHSNGFSKAAAIIGAIWLVARVGYAVAYNRDPAKRGLYFTVGLVATTTLLGMAALSIVKQLIAGA